MRLRASLILVLLLSFASTLIFLPFDLQAMGLRVRVSDILILASIPVLIYSIMDFGVLRWVEPYIFSIMGFSIYTSINALVLTGPSVAAKEFIQFTLFLVLFLGLLYCLGVTLKNRIFLISFITIIAILASWNAVHHLTIREYSGWKSLGDLKLTHAILLLALIALLTSDRIKASGFSLYSLFICIAISLLMVVLAGERKSWLALVPALLFLTLQTDLGGFRRRALARCFIIGLLGFAIVASVILLGSLIPYLEKQTSSLIEAAQLVINPEQTAATTLSNQGRLFATRFAVEQFLSSPGFGIGAENYLKVIRTFNIDPRFQHAPHNELLRIAAELGSVGLLFYGLLHITIIFRIIHLLKQIYLLDHWQAFQVRFGTALFMFGFVINLFLAGGGLNTFFHVFPAALIFSIQSPYLSEKRQPHREMSRDDTRRSLF